MAHLFNRNILLGVSGGIAAYKVCEVVSRLVQRGAGVTVAMTRAARQFVGPITFQALSGRRVLTDLWSSDEPTDVRHVSVTDAADVVVIAPATANVIGKVAAGIADEMVTTLVIAASSPVILAPAMNERMWANPVVQHNVKILSERDYEMVGPSVGWLACRGVGEGRMAEQSEIVDAVQRRLVMCPPRAVAKQVPPVPQSAPSTP